MSTLRLALSSDAWPPTAPADWDTRLQEAKRAGFEGLALWDTPLSASLALAPLASNLGLLPCAVSYAPGLSDGQGIATALNEINPTLDALAAAHCEILLVSEPRQAARAGVAGRVHEAGARGLRDDEWQNLADGLNELGARCQARGLRLAFCPAVGTYVETPTELRRLMNLTDASLVGLCLDVGSYIYAGGNPAEALSTYRWRLALLRVQDVNTGVLDAALRQGLDLPAAEARGVFCGLGEGHVAWQPLFATLIESGYGGWLVLGPGTMTAGPAEAFARLRGLLPTP